MALGRLMVESAAATISAAAPKDAPFRVLPEKTLVPDAPPGVLHRPELADRLDPVRRRLTVLVTPGGFGKTTLLADCCRRASARGDQVVWLSIDEQDDARRVVAHMAYAIDVPWDRADSVLGLAQGAEMHHLDALFAAIREDGRRWVLAVDELDRIAASGAVVIDHLIWRAPANLHLALACRQLPHAIDIATPIADGRGIAVGVEEMRFTPAELGSFFGGTVSRERLRELWTESEGWPVAACLRRNLVQAGQDEIPDLSLNWVAARLMRGVARPDRRFILEAACFEWVDAQMFDEVLGTGAAARLQGMSILRGLVQGIDGGASFRLHPLVRRHAVSELLLRGDAADLHRRIAGALERRGRTVDAMRQALEANDGDLAAEIFQRAGAVRMVMRAGVQGLRDAVALFPEDTVGRFPRVELASHAVRSINHQGTAWIDVGAPADGDAELYIDRLFVCGLGMICGCARVGSPEVRSAMAATLQAAVEYDLDALALAGFSYGQAIFNFERGDIPDARIAVRRIGEFSHDCPSATMSAKILDGAIRFACGDVHGSEVALTAAQRAAQRDFAGHESPELICSAFAAEVALETNRITAAARRVPALGQLASVGAWLDVFAASVDVRAELAFRQNAPERALRILDEAWAFAQSRRLPGFVRWLAAIRVSARIKVGQVDKADWLWRQEGYLTDAEVLVDLEHQSWREMEALCCARIRLLVARGECGAAVEFGHAFAACARDKGLARPEVWATALAMHAAWLGGDVAVAQEFLIENLRLIHRTGFTRALVEHAEAAIAVLERLDNLPGELYPAKKTALEAIGTVGGDRTEPDLTGRQIEILLRLPQASDKEIARALDISENGVRYHIKKIYGELGAANRAEATAKARRLGLVPPPPESAGDE